MAHRTASLSGEPHGGAPQAFAFAEGTPRHDAQDFRTTAGRSDNVGLELLLLFFQEKSK